MSSAAVRVDPQRCQGHGLCIYAAPAVFDLDADGYASVLVDVVPADQLNDARRAIDSCPASAITFVPASAAADAAPSVTDSAYPGATMKGPA